MEYDVDSLALAKMVTRYIPIVIVLPDAGMLDCRPNFIGTGVESGHVLNTVDYYRDANSADTLIKARLRDA